MAHLSVSTYREWESDRHVPWPGAALRRLAALFRVPVDFLLRGEQEEEE